MDTKHSADIVDEAAHYVTGEEMIAVTLQKLRHPLMDPHTYTSYAAYYTLLYQGNC
jgi:hypothetical protein